ncbi:flavin reductase [Aeromicrobium panaciterrae]|uniref:flavin reductase family protein n=1 Tax=Aeromicrobium panaciterrae TaxID=363861 RepID=UPI0031DAC258
MTASKIDGSATDPQWFREVLGQYPSGVCIVTAIGAGGDQLGMVVSSFTSVSLNPPMVAFYPSNTSQTWPEFSGATSLCINVLAADQEQVCRQFASAPTHERFDGVAIQSAPSGAPVIEGVVAWMDCVPTSVQEAGDHYIVLATVTDLQIESPKLPLLFLRGGYGSFSPLNFTASDMEGVLTSQLRYLDIVRPVLQTLPDSGLRCLITTSIRDRVVVIGRFDPPAVRDEPEPTTLVGQELPFRPPGPSIFRAWSGAASIDGWLAGFTPEVQEAERATLAGIRERGYSVGLISEGQRRFAMALEKLAVQPGTVTPEELNALIARLEFDPPVLSDDILRSVRLITAPVFDEDGHVVLAITAFGFAHDISSVRGVIDRLTTCSAEATRLIGGAAPPRDEPLFRATAGGSES